MLEFNKQIGRSDGTLTTLKDMVQNVDNISEQMEEVMEALTGAWAQKGNEQLTLTTGSSYTDLTSALQASDLQGKDIKIQYMIYDTDSDEDMLQTTHYMDGDVLASFFGSEEVDAVSAEIDSYYYAEISSGIIIKIKFNGSSGKFLGIALNAGSYSSDIRARIKISTRPKVG